MKLQSIIEFEKTRDTVQILCISFSYHSTIGETQVPRKAIHSVNVTKSYLGGQGWEDDERQEKQSYVSSARLSSVFPSPSQKQKLGQLYLFMIR